ncbi:TauD/TfdA family dioxygenase [uncultured Vibrio sp.]|uniref:TauD/TfdA family dioxygenase n=1 Tax=uncultured Vibrio sp. TaxID=114054 RepID=UPI00260EC862|nr:TauD/TfdA family dioxygenase [uncultured Vibrio sp.]
MDYLSFHDQMAHYFKRPHNNKIPLQPITGEAAWFGKDLQQTPEQWLFHFSDADNQELWRAVELSKEVPASAINRNNFTLENLQQRCQRWKTQLSTGLGVVIIRGLQLDGRSEQDCERLFWGLGHHLGLPGAQNARQELLGHVTDCSNGDNDLDERLYRTNEHIAYHCDAADVVGLLCLQPAKQGGRSKVVSSVTLYNELLQAHPELVDRLFSPFRLDLRDKGSEESWIWVDPCTYDDNQLRTFYHSDYFRSIERHPHYQLTDEEQAILDFYDNKAKEEGVPLEMDMQVGDIQLISNHITLHSRTHYLDDPQAKRHLLRLWLSL